LRAVVLADLVFAGPVFVAATTASWAYKGTCKTPRFAELHGIGRGS
jgi:hypothetical protein